MGLSLRKNLSEPRENFSHDFLRFYTLPEAPSCTQIRSPGFMTIIHIISWSLILKMGHIISPFAIFLKALYFSFQNHILINHNGKENEKECMYNQITLLYSRN